MTKYAAETTVSAEASRAQIERTLRRYGADAFVFAEDRGEVTIMFRIEGRMIRFRLPMPDPQDRAFTHVNKGAIGVQPRSLPSAQKAWEQACRQRWRALALIILAKLEAVAAGVVSIEDEFLAQTMTSDGRTVAEVIKPKLDEHLRVGGPLILLLEGPR